MDIFFIINMLSLAQNVVNIISAFSTIKVSDLK